MAMHRRAASIAVVLLVAAGVVAGVIAWSDAGWATDLRDRLGMGQRSGDTIEASGSIEAPQVRISAQTLAKVKRREVAEGDRIAIGDLLAVLESPALASQIDEGEAAVRSAQAQLDRVTAGARPEEIVQARSALSQTLAARDGAAGELEQAVAARSAASAADPALAVAVVKARAAYDSAIAEVAGAEARLDLALAPPAPYQLDLARAGVRQAEAKREGLLLQLQQLDVRSPITATVGTVAVRDGDAVMPGTLMMRLLRLDAVDLTVYVSEKDLGRVSLGQHADVTVDALSDETFAGEVTSIAREAEFTPHNVQTEQGRETLVFAVRIRIPNPDRRLKPGMPATAAIETSEE
jgi:HlyD family secretion protein